MNMRALAAVLIGGILLPYGHPYTFLVRYMVMGMLFFAFLDMRIAWQVVRRSHLWVLLANLGLALAAYAIFQVWYPVLAMPAFVVGIMPTAAGAPVITHFLKGDVAYVTFSTLFTTIVIALLLPWLLPLLSAQQAALAPRALLLPVLGLLLIPLGTALAIRLLSTRLRQQVLRYQKVSSWLFLASIYLAMSKASHYLRTQMPEDWTLLLWIGLLSGLLCLAGFELGRLLGRPHHPLEASMALGRKNTIFAVWIALTFVGPLAALGPMFYIIWQNLYNYRQLESAKNDGPPAPRQV